MVEAIAEDTFTAVRNAARERFAATGKSYADLSKADLHSLRDHIAEAMGAAKLIDGTFKMNAHIKAVRWPTGWAALTCRSHYFRKREAVTFNGNGFIGFAGWADAENVKPIIAGFLAWCDTITTNVASHGDHLNPVVSQKPENLQDNDAAGTKEVEP